MTEIKEIKVFGAALDPSDSEKKIMIKRKYLDDLHYGRKTKHSIYTDSYEVFINESRMLKKSIFTKIGKFPVESWLRTKPNTEDIIFIQPAEFRTFLDSNGCKEYSNEMKNFIEKKVLPAIPLMIGADHSLTGGVLDALSNKYGAEDITIIILDGHFDAIPTQIRFDLAKYSKEHKNEVEVIFPEVLDSINEFMTIPQTYNCGTFLTTLTEEKVILPENVIVYGCQDCPDMEFKKIEDDRVTKYVDFYSSLEDQGIKIIPYNKENNIMINSLKKALDQINTPYLYISIDVDVGSLNSVLAARFMEFIGVDEDNLNSVSELFKDTISSKELKLIGMDIMELEVFFLNAELKSGKKDKTIEIMDKFLELFDIN